MENFEILRPFNRDPLSLRNRTVRSATAERFSDPRGVIESGLVGQYRSLAEGGVGLIITGHMFVREDGQAGACQTGIFSDDHIPGLRQLCDAVHEIEGAKVVAQINHGGRQGSTEILPELIAPSPVPIRFTDTVPREVSVEEIFGLIQAFGDAARRVMEAGFDGVQLHAAHGYLISQFLSPYTNRREDDWGGTSDNRRRFLLETYKHVRSVVGDDYPILIKINGEDLVPGGVTVEETIETVRQLTEIGLWGYEISGGIAESTTKIIRKRVAAGNEGYFLDTARRFRELDPGAVRIVVGGLRSLPVMEAVIANGDADMVSMCRPFIREPDLVARWLAGDTAPSGCISSNLCLKDRTSPTSCHDIL